MNSSERLYQLLPAIYRIRDYELGNPQQQDSQRDGPLKKFLSAIAQELQLLEGDIGDLYENWYIETCDDWVVPYIGDLVGIRELYAPTSSKSIKAGQRIYGIQERRAYVANTIAYRRRKGTASVLEQLARDVTGWGARVVEFWDLLALTQNLDHIRKQNKTVNLRSATQLDLLGTPFESETAYTIQVRPTRSGNGRYNLPHIGLYIWRLSSYPIHRGTARLVTDNLTPESIGRCYTFSPLKNSKIQLFNRPETETEITQLTEEINLPIPLSRRPNFEGYQGKNPVLQIFINGQADPIPPEEVLITTLGKSLNGPEESDKDDRLSSPQPHELPQRTKIVAVDPELGRIEFLDRSLPQRVEVSYSYGFSGDIGGGSYERDDDMSQLPAATSGSFDLTWEIEQAKSTSANPLAEAIQSWNSSMVAWQGLSNKISIPLAKITIPPIQASSPSLTQEAQPRKFQAGIINGLEVIALPLPGTQVAVVTPGQAIDGQGREIVVNCHSSLDLSQMNPNGMPEQAVLIVVSYCAGCDNQTGQFNLIPVTEFIEQSDRYPQDIYLTLACLVLNRKSEIVEIHEDSKVPEQSSVRSQPGSFPQLRPQFVAGIINGLELQTPTGALEAIIATGMAVDDQGQVILLSSNKAVSLKDHQGETVWLVISAATSSTQETDPLQVIREADAENGESDPEKTYLRLVKLKVGSLNSEGWELDSTVRSRYVAADSPQVTDNQAKPGVVKGLRVSLAGNKPGEVIVRKGEAIDSQGNSIVLQQDYHLDFTSFAGQTLTLFISQEQNLGWQPLKVISSSNSSEDWRQLGIVPEQPLKQLDCPEQPSSEPEKITTGIIIIRDNATYSGNLEIKIPADRKLTIIAANSRRPHILGNISVRGIAAIEPLQEPNIIEQGELNLNGLLIEGKLTVEPGNLRWLNLSHCTLVPQQGGLMVNSAIANIDTEDGETWTLIALVMYWINLIVKLIQTGFKSDCQSPQTVLTQLNQLAAQEAQHMFLILQEIVEQLQNNNSNPSPILKESDVIPFGSYNARLKINILRSICGAIQLTDTIPELEIVDSIIDRTSQNLDITAIAAPQTQVKIATSTIFGSTRAGNLEASDSIFNRQVTVTRRQHGCLRFCYLPDGSQTPPRYQCQPDLTLVEELEPLPKAISSLAVEKRRGHLFAGTAGDGIYHSLNQGGNWSKIQDPQISQQHITSLIAYAEPLAGTITLSIPFWKRFLWQIYLFLWSIGSGSYSLIRYFSYPIINQETIVKGTKTAFTQVFQEGDAIVAHNQVRTVDNILSDTNLTVNASFEGEIPLSETPFFIPNQGKGKITSEQVTLRGQGTAFTRELQEGDVIIAANQSRTIISIQSDTQVRIDSAFEEKLENQLFFLPFRGHGTISSTGTTVKGENTTFTKVFQNGDAIIAHNQIRTITKINSDYELTIDRAFKGFRLKNLPIKFWLRLLIMNILAGVLFLYESLKTDLPKKTPFFISGKTYIIAGTGDGEVWLSPGRIESWQQINTGSINTAITDLVTYATVGDGTISSAIATENIADNSEQLRIIGNETAFQTELEVGDTITVAEETRIIQEIISDTELLIDRPFPESLPLGTTFRINRFLAGTAGHGVFRFGQREQNWHPLNMGLTNLNITTLAVSNNQQIFAGTAGGGIFRFSTSRNCWEAVNDGLTDLQVTAITIDEAETILVGTEVGGVFVSTANGDRWSLLDNSPVNLKITALITSITDSQSEIEELRLIVATAGGGIFTYIYNQGIEEQEIDSLTIRNITTMVRGIDQKQIFAGTSWGGILAYSDNGLTLVSSDRILVNIEQKLALLDQLQPSFTSENYGDPGYAQLGKICPHQIYTGAEDGSEMGVFNYLKQPQRQQNLDSSLDDYLRFGLEKSIFYIT